MRRIVWMIGAVLTAAALTSCTPEANSAVSSAPDPAGFWLGLWHGFITLFTFVISLFTDNINIYEINNNGGWYNFGYVLGVMSFWGGGSGGVCCGKKD